jgi:membrane protease YdiL (CAAX protease family)
MGNKILNFLKYISISMLYVILFVLVQSFVMIGLLAYKIVGDAKFQEDLLKMLEPMYDENILYSEYTAGFLGMVEDIIVPTLFISNLLIVIIIGIKILVSNKKEHTLKKLPLEDVFKYAIIGILANLGISLIISLLPTSLIESHASTTDMVLGGNPIIVLFATGIFAPIAEEFMCRYGMQKNLTKINPIFGIIMQSLVFGLLHGNLVQSTYAFVLGLFFGYVVYKKENLWYSIILHMSINTSSVLASFLPFNELISMALIFGTLLVLYIITKALKNSKIKKVKIDTDLEN